MLKHVFYFCLAVGMAIAAPRSSDAQVVGGVVSQEEAERHGLTRAWYAQADVDSSLGNVVDATLQGNTLFVQTSRAQLQAIDAETGQTLWSVSVGNEHYPCSVPGASADYVATTNGSTLYVIDRKTGREAWKKELPHVPGSGPAVTPTHVFVAMVNGTIQGYELKKPKGIPFIYKSNGRVLVAPVVTADALAWTTEQGYMYLMKLADPDHLAVNFRLETNAKIESRPGHWTPFLYSVSLDGYVYAVHEETGRIQWKYATAEPIVEPPVAVNGKVYVCVVDGGMFCLNGETGEGEWYAPTITQFISASPSRVYACDRLNRLIILDGKTGARLDSFAIGGVARKLRNTQSDRIFLTTDTGIVQCLHETDLAQPVVYTPPPLKKEKPKTQQKKLDAEEAQEPAADEDAGTDEDAAFEEAPAEEAPAAEDDNPFGADDAATEEKPAAEEEEKMEDDNPFG